MASTRASKPVLAEIPVLVIAPQLAPCRTVRHASTPACLAHLRVEVPRLLGRKPVRLDPPRGDQKMRVPVRPLALRLRPVRRVDVELHRKTLGDEMLLREGTHQCEPVLRRDLPVGRQGEHDLAGDLGVLAALCRFRRVPQLARLAETLGRAIRQQHGMVLGRVAVAEVEHLARAFGGDLLPAVVGGRPHGAAAGAAGDVAGTGKCDGHAGTLAALPALRKPRCPCNAYCVCTPPLAYGSLGAEPAARVLLSPYPVQRTFRTEHRVTGWQGHSSDVPQRHVMLAWVPRRVS